MPSHDAAAIARRWCELYSDGTPDSYGSDRVLELYAPDCEWIEHSNLNGTRRGGPEDLRRILRENAASMRDRRVQLHRVIGGGEEVAMHCTWSATLAEDAFGRAKGTRPMAEVASLLRVRDSVIVRIEEFVTNLRAT
jgi:ketosteroid isomerase-like protein